MKALKTVRLDVVEPFVLGEPHDRTGEQPPVKHPDVFALESEGFPDGLEGFHLGIRDVEIEQHGSEGVAVFLHGPSNRAWSRVHACAARPMHGTRREAECLSGWKRASAEALYEPGSASKSERKVFEALDTMSVKTREEQAQEFCCGKGVRRGDVRPLDLDPRFSASFAEAASLTEAHEGAERHHAEMRSLLRDAGVAKLPVQEPGVERSVVGRDDASIEGVEYAASDLAEARGVGNVFLGDAVDLGRFDRPARVHQGIEGEPRRLSRVEANDRELEHAVISRREPSRFEVDDRERSLG